jgi:hypothetical protein
LQLRDVITYFLTSKGGSPEHKPAEPGDVLVLVILFI